MEGRLRGALTLAAAVVAATLLLAGCSGDDDDGGDNGGENGTPTPTAEDTVTATPGVTLAPGFGCELLGRADVESVLGPVFTQQPIEPDEFESCFAFVQGGEIVLDACDRCLTGAEFADEVEASARGRGTTATPVMDLGDEAHWVPAGDSDPNTGLLWVLSDGLTLSLWVKLTTYDSEADAQADSIELVNNMLGPAPATE